MVLHPLDCDTPDETQAATPAWQAVAERQHCRADAYLLISQPDHARLAGELAASFVSPGFPHMDASVAQAIGAHDSGWAAFKAESDLNATPPANCNGKPLAFIEFSPPEFLRAWNGSIERAESICPAGGIIVSRHFCELADFRLKSGALSEDDRSRIMQFLDRESVRQQRLLQACEYSEQELNGFLQALKFCDLLSLCLCAGVRWEVEFPQDLTGSPVRLSSSGENEFRLDPSPFQAEGAQRILKLSVPARTYSSGAQTEVTRLEFMLS